MRDRNGQDWKWMLRNGRGNGVRVGLLDTGVQSDHHEISPGLFHYEIVKEECGGEMVRQVGKGADWNEHGTACAGILQEMAPDAELHSVQIIGDAPRGAPSKLIAGFRFAVEAGWDVINISAGAGRHHAELQEIAERAWEAGIIVVAAKDNRPGEIGFPAVYPEVLAVDMEHFEDPFGFRFDPKSGVEVEAKGIYIDAPCASGGRKLYTGSSFAAPHVSAMAARLKSVEPDLGPAMFREALAELGEGVSRAATV